MGNTKTFMLILSAYRFGAYASCQCLYSYIYRHMYVQIIVCFSRGEVVVCGGRPFANVSVSGRLFILR